MMERPLCSLARHLFRPAIRRKAMIAIARHNLLQTCPRNPLCHPCQSRDGWESLQTQRSRIQYCVGWERRRADDASVMVFFYMLMVWMMEILHSPLGRYCVEIRLRKSYISAFLSLTRQCSFNLNTDLVNS